MLKASALRVPKILPDLIVFDLDMCFWSPEMYELSEIPSSANGIKGSEDIITAVKSGSDLIKLFPASLQFMKAYHAGEFGNDMKIAAASSADTPHAVKIGRAALDILEVVPGVTVREVFRRGWPVDFEGNLQIGRTPPLSSNKAMTHFPILHKETGISYDKMIFFDDCNWGDHCANVAKHCKGVVTQRTPRGLQLNELQTALDVYEKKEMELKTSL